MFDWTNGATTGRVVDFSSARTGVVSGMAAGTRIATQLGWRPVEAVVAGDLVLTFDAGLQPVKEVRRDMMWTADAAVPKNLWPLEVPAGALGNRETMWLLAEQSVLIESDAAEELLGDPFALIPAAALEGFRGIHRVLPMREIEVITLHFAQDEIVFANIGALFFCPKAGDIISDIFDTASTTYNVLSLELADALIELLEVEDENRRSPTYAQQQQIYAVA